jgi:hypothetical protein
MTQTITLQHTVACDFAQIRAAQAPQGTCNRVLFDQRLPSSAMQSDVIEMQKAFSAHACAVVQVRVDLAHVAEVTMRVWQLRDLRPASRIPPVMSKIKTNSGKFF